jgi:hypothetical protein
MEPWPIIAEMWPIIRLTLIHCVIVTAVCGIIAGTVHVCSLFYPAEPIMVLWLHGIDNVSAIFILVALAIMLVSSVFRIVLDAIVSVWKGFPNGNTHCILA